MSFSSLNCEGIVRIPDLRVVNQKHLLSLPEYHNNEDVRADFLETIRSHDMGPFYEKSCKDLHWTCDADLLNIIKKNNETELANLNANIETVKTVCSITEVRDAYLEKAMYLAGIGDKDNALKTLSQAFGHTVAVGYKIDNVLTATRIGFFHYDHQLIQKGLARVDDLAVEGTDHDKRNRLKIYKGLYGLLKRDFALASDMFLNTIATFACNELIDYTTFIRYTVVSAALNLDRAQLKEQIIENPNVLEALHKAPDIKNYVFSLYNCEYAKFFRCLAEVEKMFRENYILYPHYRYYVREMRIKVYAQFLRSYKSVTFVHMAKAFEVTPDFIEDELFRFISAGRIYAKIDKINNSIVPSSGVQEKRSELFKKAIKQGDLVLNRIHHLSRVLDYSI